MSESTRRVRTDRLGLPGRLLSDQALAARITGGDSSACDELFRRYHQPIYRFCSAMVGPEEAKDVLQNVMTKAMTSMPHDEDFQMKPWLYRVARNECVDQLRLSRRVATGLEADTRADDSGRRDPHQVAVERERLDQLIEDLNDLPEKQRATLVLRELSGLSFAEIGQSLGTSESGAKQLVYEARLSLEQADLGRKLDCAEVRESISSQDRRRLRGRKVRSHMRACGSCSAFAGSISRREAGFNSLFPVLPVGASIGILDAIHGGASSAGAAAGGTAASAGGLLAGGAATGLVTKGVAVLVVAGGIGVGTAEVVKQRDSAGSREPVSRTVDLDTGGSVSSFGIGTGAAVSTPLPGKTPDHSGTGRSGAAGEDRPDRSSSGSDVKDGAGAAAASPAERITPGQGNGQGPASLPEAASKGQSRADEASSAKPGQTGAPPPARKPVSPPGQSGGSGTAPGNSSNASIGSPGKSVEAPAVGKPESPGKSGK